MDTRTFGAIASWLILLIKLFIIGMICFGLSFIPNKGNRCYSSNGSLISDSGSSNFILNKDNSNIWNNTQVLLNTDSKILINGILSYGQKSIVGNPKIVFTDLLNFSVVDEEVINKKGLVVGKGGILGGNGLKDRFLIKVQENDKFQLGVNIPLFSVNSNMTDMLGKYWNGDCSANKIHYYGFCGHYSPWVGQAAIAGKCLNGRIDRVYKTKIVPELFAISQETKKFSSFDICANGDIEFNFENNILDDNANGIGNDASEASNPQNILHTWLHPFYALQARIVLVPKDGFLGGNDNIFLSWVNISDLQYLYNEHRHVKFVRGSVQDLLRDRNDLYESNAYNNNISDSGGVNYNIDNDGDVDRSTKSFQNYNYYKRMYSDKYDMFLEFDMYNIAHYSTIGGGYVYLYMTDNTVVNGNSINGDIWISHGKNQEEVEVNAVRMRVEGNYIDIPPSFDGKKLWIKFNTQELQKGDQDKVFGEMEFFVENNGGSDTDVNDTVFYIKGWRVWLFDQLIKPIVKGLRDAIRVFMHINICNSYYCSLWIQVCRMLLLLASVVYVSIAFIYQTHNTYDSIIFSLKIVFVNFIISPGFFEISDNVYMLLRSEITKFIGGLFQVLFNVDYGITDDVEDDDIFLLKMILSPGIRFIDKVPYLLAKSTVYASAYPIGIFLTIIILFCVLALLMSFIDVMIAMIFAYINIDIALALAPFLVICIVFDFMSDMLKRYISIIIHCIFTIIVLGIGYYFIFFVAVEVLESGLICGFSMCMKNLYSIYILNFSWFIPWGYGGETLYDKVYLDILNIGSLVVIAVVSGPYVNFLMQNVDKMSSSFGSNIAPNVSSAMFSFATNAINNPKATIWQVRNKFIDMRNMSGLGVAYNVIKNRYSAKKLSNAQLAKDKSGKNDNGEAGKKDGDKSVDKNAVNSKINDKLNKNKNININKKEVDGKVNVKDGANQKDEAKIDNKDGEQRQDINKKDGNSGKKVGQGQDSADKDQNAINAIMQTVKEANAKDTEELKQYMAEVSKTESDPKKANDMVDKKIKEIKQRREARMEKALASYKPKNSIANAESSPQGDMNKILEDNIEQMFNQSFEGPENTAKKILSMPERKGNEEDARMRRVAQRILDKGSTRSAEGKEGGVVEGGVVKNGNNTENNAGKTVENSNGDKDVGDKENKDVNRENKANDKASKDVKGDQSNSGASKGKEVSSAKGNTADSEASKEGEGNRPNIV